MNREIKREELEMRKEEIKAKKEFKQEESKRRAALDEKRLNNERYQMEKEMAH